MDEEKLKELIESKLKETVGPLEEQISTLKAEVEAKDKEVADMKAQVEETKKASRNAILQAQTKGPAKEPEQVNWEKPFDIKDFALN